MENERQRYNMASSGGDPTRSNDYWRVGHLIYFNRQDSRALVPKYSGLGFTFNFAHPASLFVTLLPLIVLIGAVSLLAIIFAVNHIAATAFLGAIPLLIFLVVFLILFIIHLVSLLSRRGS